MSDEPEPEHTHRVVGKAHHRTTENDGRPGSFSTYEPGETITPTERELESLPGRFEPLDDEADAQADESGESGEQNDTTEDTDETENDESAATVDESEALTAETVENAEYEELRSMATDYDDVNGNWSADRLRAELLDRVGE